MKATSEKEVSAGEGAKGRESKVKHTLRCENGEEVEVELTANAELTKWRVDVRRVLLPSGWFVEGTYEDYLKLNPNMGVFLALHRLAKFFAEGLAKNDLNFNPCTGILSRTFVYPHGDTLPLSIKLEPVKGDLQLCIQHILSKLANVEIRRFIKVFEATSGEWDSTAATWVDVTPAKGPALISKSGVLKWSLTVNGTYTNLPGEAYRYRLCVTNKTGLKTYWPSEHGYCKYIYMEASRLENLNFENIVQTEQGEYDIQLQVYPHGDYHWRARYGYITLILELD